MKPAAERRGAEILGVHIDSLRWDDAEEKIFGWAAQGESRYVCICNVHSVVTARHAGGFRHVLARADMATPDGMPLVWLMRRRGFPEQARIDGPELMLRLCRRAARARIPVFLFGSREFVLRRLHTRLEKQFIGLNIAGSYAPPFREPTPEEDQAVIDRINRSGAGLVFVALGCPRQEQWMLSHVGKINGVMVGVGAAFDFHAGQVKRAPLWMQRAGLEWLYRMALEPRRLWRRYLVTNTLFVVYLILDSMGWRRRLGSIVK